MDCANIPIPRSESDITASWIHSVAGVKPLPNSVSIQGNIQDGVGFLSSLCRVSFQTEEGGPPQTILVKLLPVSPEYKALILSESFDQREIQFYEIVMPRVLEVAPQIEENFVKYFGGKSASLKDEDYASMVIMEDLKPLGYQMLNPESAKWVENLEKVVEFLARFHAASYRFEKKKEKSVAEVFPFCIGAGKWDPGTFLTFGRECVPRVDKLLDEDDVSSEIKAAYKALGAEYEKIYLGCLDEAAKYECLLHADVWPPNIMVVEQETGSGAAPPVKIIDWQLLSYRDPVVEVTVAILTCLPIKELKRANVQRFCQVYWETFKKEMKDCKERVRETEQFQKDFDTWGMVYAYLWLLLSVDSFPNDQDKLRKVFVMLEEDYKISEFLENYLETKK